MNLIKAFLIILIFSLVYACKNADNIETSNVNIVKETTIDSASVQVLDQNYGFNKIKLGTSRKDLSNLIFISNYEINIDGISGSSNVIRLETFIKTNDIKQIGSFKIDTVFYEFYKDKLYKIKVDLPENNELILNSFKELYGEPVNKTEEIVLATGLSNENFPITEYHWNGEKVELALREFNIYRAERKREKYLAETKDEKSSTRYKLMSYAYTSEKPLSFTYTSKVIESQIKIDSDSIRNNEKVKLKKSL